MKRLRKCWQSNPAVTPDLWPCCATCLFAGRPASWPPRRPPVAGGVERAARQQSLRHQEPLARVDLRPVCEGPLGAVCVQPPPTGQPAQTLPDGSQLRLALRLHPDADAHAPGRPEVSDDAALRRHNYYNIVMSHHQPCPAETAASPNMQKHGGRCLLRPVRADQSENENDNMGPFFQWWNTYSIFLFSVHPYLELL